jgi:hypothetical protein
MLKIVNQTTYEIKYEVFVTPSSNPIHTGFLEPGKIAGYRIDNRPENHQDALNVMIRTSRTVLPHTVHLENVWVPGNATVVYSTQILTGLLQPGS